MRLRIVVITLLIVSAFALAGCAKISAVFSGEEVPEATVAAPGAAVNGELPEDAPRDLPFWPGAEVLEGSSSEDAYEVTLTTRDAYDDVLAGLAKGFEDSGWEIVEEPLGIDDEMVTVLTVTTSKSEGVVTLTREASDTVISYVVTPAE